MDKICPICQQNPLKHNSKFCSKKCYGKSVEKNYTEICKNCGKEFGYKNSWFKKKGHRIYCSNSCKNTKYPFDYGYFKQMDESKWITLGRIISNGHIYDLTRIWVFSSIENLEAIKRDLKSEVPLEKSDKGLWKLTLTSHDMVKDLIELGVFSDGLKQDVPDPRCWEGMKGSHCYFESDGYCYYKTERSKQARWVSDMTGGEMEVDMFKDVFKGVPGCYFVVRWKKQF